MCFAGCSGSKYPAGSWNMELVMSSSSEDVIVVLEIENELWWFMIYGKRWFAKSWLINDYIQNLTFKSHANLYNEL